MWHYLFTLGLITTVTIYLYNKIQSIMATQLEFQAELDRINVNTTALAERLRDLEQQVTDAGLSAEVEASVLQSLRLTADALEAMANPAAPEEPETPEEPTEPTEEV